MALYVKAENVTYIDDGFGVEHISKWILKNSIGNKNIT